MARAVIQSAPFDPGVVLRGFGAGSDTGAVVSFTGIVRDTGGLRFLEIEHYPGMTERSASEIARTAQVRWGLHDALVIHRYGRLAVGEAIMMVATAAAHRGPAFEAAQFIMDHLKTRAPFWKKEVTDQGGSWVKARARDAAARADWD